MDRYRLAGIAVYGFMQAHEDGDWVKYSDVEALQAERDSCVDLTERMKVALNRIGTKGSYVEWAKECRDAYDQVQNLQARVRELEKTILTAYDMLEYKDYGAAFIQLSNRRLAILNGDYLGNLKPKGTP